MKFGYGVDEDNGKETLQFLAMAVEEEEAFMELDTKIKEGADIRLKLELVEDTWQLRLIITPKKEV